MINHRHPPRSPWLHLAVSLSLSACSLSDEPDGADDVEELDASACPAEPEVRAARTAVTSTFPLSLDFTGASVKWDGCPYQLPSFIGRDRRDTDLVVGGAVVVEGDVNAARYAPLPPKPAIVDWNGNDVLRMKLDAFTPTDKTHKRHQEFYIGSVGNREPRRLAFRMYLPSANYANGEGGGAILTQVWNQKNGHVLKLVVKQPSPDHFTITMSGDGANGTNAQIATTANLATNTWHDIVMKYELDTSTTAPSGRAGLWVDGTGYGQQLGITLGGTSPGERYRQAFGWYVLSDESKPWTRNAWGAFFDDVSYSADY